MPMKNHLDPMNLLIVIQSFQICFWFQYCGKNNVIRVTSFNSNNQVRQHSSRNTTRHPLKKVQVGKDQEKAQSEKDSHSKNRGGKKTNQQSGTYTMKIFRKPNEQLFSQ